MNKFNWSSIGKFLTLRTTFFAFDFEENSRRRGGLGGDVLFFRILKKLRGPKSSFLQLFLLHFFVNTLLEYSFIAAFLQKETTGVCRQ